MASARTTHEPDCHSLARFYSRALLPLAIAGLFAACGGGGGQAVCTMGPASTILAWNAVAGATGYIVYFSTAPGSYLMPSEGVVSVPGNVTTHTLTGLESAMTYYFSVTAFDGSNIESNPSNEVCKTISN